MIDSNNITNNHDGVYFWNVSGSTVARNSIVNSSYWGIELYEATDNIIVSNRIEECRSGVYMSVSSGTLFCHNSFLNNTQQAEVYYCNSTAWDDGSEGNYWSDHSGVDLNSDGISEAFYQIDAENMDRYPLMGVFYDFTVSSPSAPGNTTYRITLISNSTISDLRLVSFLSQVNESLQQTEMYVVFNASGNEGNGGFCRIMFPREVRNGSYAVFVNQQEVNFTELAISNETNVYLYFTYTHSTLEVVVIPEFPLLLGLFVFMFGMIGATVRLKRRQLTRRKCTLRIHGSGELRLLCWTLRVLDRTFFHNQ
jgi:parallel beta-helix repeat protein